MGFVFSPSYAAARRAAAAGQLADIDPRTYCAVNVAVYRRDRRIRWVCNEYAAHDRRASENELCIGRSRIERGQGNYRLVLDEPLTTFGGLWQPSTRLVGEIELTPKASSSPIVCLTDGSAGSGQHCWRALAPLSEVEVRCGDLRFRGSGYLDSNVGSRPLEADFRRWSWCRVADERQAEVIYDYELRDGTRRAVTLAADPHHTSVSEARGIRSLQSRRSLWGIRIDRTEVTSEAAHPVGRRVLPGKIIDDTPFYARYLARVEPTTHAPRVGIGESLDLDRFDNRLVQRMLAYRISAAKPNGASP